MCWIQIDIDVVGVDFPGRGGGNLGCLFVYSLSMQCLRPLGYCAPYFPHSFFHRLLADCFFLFVTAILAFAFVCVAASNVSLSFLELFYNRNFLFFVVTEKVSFSVWQLLNLETKRTKSVRNDFFWDGFDFRRTWFLRQIFVLVEVWMFPGLHFVLSCDPRRQVTM